MVTHEILDAERITENIEELLREQHGALMGAMSAAGWPVERIATHRLHLAAEALAAQLRSNEGRPAAQAILKLAIASRLDGQIFYASNLGRAVAWWIGIPAPGGTPSPTLVAAALGVTRQRAGELQRAGRADTPEAVAEELQRRWPR